MTPREKTLEAQLFATEQRLKEAQHKLEEAKVHLSMLLTAIVIAGGAALAWWLVVV